MLPPLASVEELSSRLGVALDPESVDGIRAAAALTDASSLVRGEAGVDYVDDHGELVDDIPDEIVSITLAAAARGYRNPDGKVQASNGDVSVSYSFQSGGAAVYLTKAEMRAIRRAVGGSQLTSVELTSGYLIGRDPHYVPTTDPNSDWIPIGPFPWEP